MTEKKSTTLADVCADMIKGGAEMAETLPRAWITRIENEFINPLQSADFWEIVCGAPDYRAVKYSTRYFPIKQFGAEPETKEEWKALTDASKKSSYPDMADSEIKHSNHDAIGGITNFGAITSRELKVPFGMDVYESVVRALKSTRQTDILAKLMYYIMCGADTYMMAWRDPTTIETVAELLDDSKFGDIIQHGLWRSNYILAHEEEVQRASGYKSVIDEKSNCVFTYEQIQGVKWLPKVSAQPADSNPLITACPGHNRSLYQSMIFHLQGARSIASIDEIRKRINILTNGSLKGFEKWENVALVGSTITECVGNNSLLDFPGGFAGRSELYYGNGDIDIAVCTQSYKEFCDQVTQMTDLISANLGEKVDVKSISCGSGVRFHVSHPKLARHYEIFRTPLPLIRLVAGFHVWAVKALWNFRTLIMTRSFVVAMLTGVCESFDWFSCNKIPVDVVLKNAQRGYTIPLSQRELKTTLDYFRETKGAWSYKTIKSTADFTGSYTKNSPFFRIDMFPAGLRAGKPPVQNTSTDVDNDHTYKQPIGLRYKGKRITNWKDGPGGTFSVTMPPEW